MVDGGMAGGQRGRHKNACLLFQFSAGYGRGHHVPAKTSNAVQTFNLKRAPMTVLGRKLKL